MAITADYHMHSYFSGDSKAPMKDMIEAGLSKGLTHMCFTEHMDLGYPGVDDIPKDGFEVNTDSYLYELLKMRDEYEGKIKLLFGIELGIQTSCLKEIAAYAKAFDFDFIIASSHVVRGMDIVVPEFYADRTDEEAYREYFETELENIKKFKNFDVYGHLDYVVRYGASKDKNYSYEKYRDLFDKMLEELLDNEKGIEINTAGLRKGLGFAHPHIDILKKYKSLGGEIVTIGSDAHKPEDVAADFNVAEDMLKECGFKYYTIFENRIPEYKKL
ncbi:MAG: histidinol-phosphatase HisJ family protein [Lachnospiraceae bacterium]|nr:histidinol-phosphatase HisJ family protein [Lachnospiraceae bacterium]